MELLPPNPDPEAASRGAIIAITADHWVQQIGCEMFVAHQKVKFRRPPRVGAVVEIVYPTPDHALVRTLGAMCSLTAERGGARSSSQRTGVAVAFECSVRASALREFPELADVYAIVDAAEARAWRQFKDNMSAVRMVVRANRAAMLRLLDRGGWPSPRTVAQALAQGTIPGVGGAVSL